MMLLIHGKNHALFSLAILFFFLLNSCCSKPESSMTDDAYPDPNSIDEIHVGVILDMGSWTGKISHSSIAMAISDFYSKHGHYKTSLVLHTMDSRGDPLRALSVAMKLMETVNLRAIILGSETTMEVKILAELGDRAGVPIISFLPAAHLPPLDDQYPHFVHFTQDETSQAKGISSLIDAFGWRNVVLVYEETDHGRELINSIIGCFHDAGIHVLHKVAIKTLSSDQITEQLFNATILQASAFVVHLSPSSASLLFLNAKKLGMMTEGYSWILTDTTMNFLNSMDSIAVEAMQGALGFKPYFPPSKELQNFTSRWRRKFLIDNPNVHEMPELNAYGIWAYDAVWALALAAEEVGIKGFQSKDHAARKQNMMDLAVIQTSRAGAMIFKEMQERIFKGLSGEVQINHGRLVSSTYQIVNVLGQGGRRVGFWSPENGITKKMELENKKQSSSPIDDLEAIIWPGGSTTIPKHRRLLQTVTTKLKIGVPISGFPDLVNVASDPVTNATTVTGFCIDVFKASIEGLPYEVEYEFIPFADESEQMAGSYNDLIDQVFYQNYDAVVGDTTVTPNRSLYVDFTLPFSDLGVAMVVKTTNTNNMWIFLKPLAADLWLTSAAFFVLIGYVVWLIEHPINDEFKHVGTAMWFALCTLVFAHRETLKSNLSKLVVFVWVFVVLILTSSYTATLASMLTVQQIQSLSAKEGYIGFQASSILNGVISNMNFNDSRLQQYKSPDDYAEALSKGSRYGGVSAIVDEIPYLKIILAEYPDQFSMIDARPITNGFAFVFRKGSPLVAAISREIARMREEGKLKMMEDAWFGSRAASFKIAADGSTAAANSNNKPCALSLENFGGLFVISIVTSALAILIFLIINRGKYHNCKNNFRELVRTHSQSVRNILRDKICATAA